MKKINRLPNRMTSIILVLILVMGLAPMWVCGTEIGENTGQTTDVIIEDLEEGDSTEEATEDSTVQNTDTVALEEETVVSYSVTLDANGGFFINEWDDVLAQVIEKSDVLNRTIPAGEIINNVPILEKDGHQIAFVGWSFTRDGELVPSEPDGYCPDSDCTLYAIWETVSSENDSMDSSNTEEIGNDEAVVTDSSQLINEQEDES